MNLAEITLILPFLIVKQTNIGLLRGPFPIAINLSSFNECYLSTIMKRSCLKNSSTICISNLLSIFSLLAASQSKFLNFNFIIIYFPLFVHTYVLTHNSTMKRSQVDLCRKGMRYLFDVSKVRRNDLKKKSSEPKDVL